MIVRAVPAALKAKLVEEAVARDVTMTEVFVEALVAEFGGDWTPTGRPTLQVGDAENVVLRLPAETRKAIAVRAAEIEGTNRTVALAVLAKRYRLPEPTPDRRRRRRDAAGTGG